MQIVKIFLDRFHVLAKKDTLVMVYLVMISMNAKLAHVIKMQFALIIPDHFLVRVEMDGLVMGCNAKM